MVSSYRRSAEGLPGGEDVRDDLAVLPAGGDDEHDPVSRVRSRAHDAAAGDALVVGVGVERHQGGHGAGA